MSEFFNAKLFPIMQDILLLLYLLTFLAGIFLFLYFFYIIIRKTVNSGQKSTNHGNIDHENIDRLIEKKIAALMDEMLQNKFRADHENIDVQQQGREAKPGEGSMEPAGKDQHFAGIPDEKEVSPTANGQKDTVIKLLLNDYYLSLNELTPDIYMEKWKPTFLKISNITERSLDSSISVMFEETLDFTFADFWKFELASDGLCILPVPRVQQYIISHYNSTGSGLYISGIYQVQDGRRFEIARFARVKKEKDYYLIDFPGVMIIPASRQRTSGTEEL